MQELNQNRIVISRIILASAFAIGIFTQGYIPQDTFMHELSDSIGLILLGICMLGRIYCTLQIGGRKNAKLVTSGIYSVVRNPLYLFSFLGVLGISLISNQLTVGMALIAAFFLIYIPLIEREEVYLQQTFGAVFSAYLQRVPRFIPNLRLYQPPTELNVNIRALHNALRDALWWLVPLIVFEFIEWVHAMGIVTPIVKLL